MAKNLLPSDAELFFREGRQLFYDADGSSIGRISMKSYDGLALSTISIQPGGHEEINDPYSVLEGQYHINVISLVESSEDYNPEGLLCWIVELKCFGSIDPEHGTVISFPAAQWWDIVRAPLAYLDSLWGTSSEVVERILPWLHFEFKFADRPLTFKPYPSRCNKHACLITRHAAMKPDLFDTIQRRELDDWIIHYVSDFPNSGVSTAENQLLSCIECRHAEDQWLVKRFEAIEPLEAKINSSAWVQCPCCQIRFATYDERSFRQSVHMTCGQRLRIVS